MTYQIWCFNPTKGWNIFWAGNDTDEFTSIICAFELTKLEFKATINGLWVN